MIRLVFTPWRNLRARLDLAAIKAFLDDTARTAHTKLRSGMERSRGGRTYTHFLRTNRATGAIFPAFPRGAPHTASAAGDYPARDTGALMGSIRTGVTQWEAEIGTNRHYSLFLVHGTSRMAKRKMSKEALQAAIPIARGRMRPFATLRIR